MPQQLKHAAKRSERWPHIRAGMAGVGIALLFTGAYFMHTQVEKGDPRAVQVCKYKAEPESIYTELTARKASSIQKELAPECNIQICTVSSIVGSKNFKKCTAATENSLANLMRDEDKDRKTLNTILDIITPASIILLVAMCGYACYLLRKKNKNAAQENNAL